MEGTVTVDFLEASDISLIVMNIPGICRPPVSAASAVSHVSWSAAKLSGLARREHTGGLWEVQKAEGLLWGWPRRWLQWQGTVPRVWPAHPLGPVRPSFLQLPRLRLALLQARHGGQL